MAKRMTATEKWNDAWFSELKSKYKLFWLYILDTCDYAGIWEVNYKLAEFQIGEKLNKNEIDKIFKGHFILLNSEKKWFIPKFISFQYGDDFQQSKSAVHKKVVGILKKHDLNTVPPLCHKGGDSVA